jgi:aspartate carbamoyltransferase regulatory subunit
MTREPDSTAPEASPPSRPTDDPLATDGGDPPAMRVAKIRDGTVLDHVRAGQALNVLSVLGIDGSGPGTVSVGMNVPSDRLGQKDVVKVEDRELTGEELAVIALLAPEATVNIVREYEVTEKTPIDRPEEVRGVLACPNPRCITASEEPVDSRFRTIDDGVRCVYCETIVRDVAAHLD